MKTLELNQMENIEGGNDCSGQVNAALLASAAFVFAAFVAGPFGLLLAGASYFVAWDNLGDCI